MQSLAERIQTLETDQHVVIKSNSMPSATTVSESSPANVQMTSFVGPSTSSSSSSSSLHGMIHPATSGHNLLFSPPIVGGGESTTMNNNSNTSTMMRKMELCFRKTETYEGMAMVLNVSLNRLLTQVTEIDTSRRRERDSIESRERKIQVNNSDYTCSSRSTKRKRQN